MLTVLRGLVTARLECLPVGSRAIRRVAGLLVAIVALGAGGIASAQYNCLPTCAVDDGRFLSIAGPKQDTLTGQAINISLAIPVDVDSFQIGIFDGDTSPRDLWGNSLGHWDNKLEGNSGEVVFELYYDDGTGDPVPLDPDNPTSPSYVLQGSSMPDNAWYDAPVVRVEDRAQSKDGQFRYQLRIHLVDPGPRVVSNFKVRLNPDSILTTIAEPFAFQAALWTVNDISVIYPNCDFNVVTRRCDGDLSESTYDGTFTFFALPGPADEPNTFDPAEFVVWDGDLDHGAHDGSTADTDDPNTPAVPRPSWAVSDTRPEGAQGVGSPADDTLSPFALRSPSVSYEITTPAGLTVVNENPSGNQEWERFRLSEQSSDADADYDGLDLPPGIYRVELKGMDMQNFNAWRLLQNLCQQSREGSTAPVEPCLQLPDVRIGDTVWHDANADGIQQAEEPGIPGVILNLYDPPDIQGHVHLIDRTVTDATGQYRFDVTPGNGLTPVDYTVEVAAENFNLAGPTGAIGDRVWLDADDDGAQDAGEPGLPNVNLVLRDATTRLPLATTQTDANGNYRFNGLAPGVYVVDVEDGTVPAGLSTSRGTTDPGPTQVITAAGEVVLDVDFGYANDNPGAAVIGDLVWTDSNRNGIREVDEPGVDAVTVELIDVGTGGVVATTDTIGGRYLFTGVAPGNYAVNVTDLRGVLEPCELISPAGVTNPTAAFTVAAGDTALDHDFGYFPLSGQALPSITDAVWLDTDRDGRRDTGEIGLAGVTVNLLETANVETDVFETVATATATTDANGAFIFPGLLPGVYRLVVSDVAGVLGSSVPGESLLPTTNAGFEGHIATVAGVDLHGDHFGYFTGGQLAAATATTASPSQTNPVSVEPVLSYDFGYFTPSQECQPCEGRVTDLIFRYLGATQDAHTVVEQNKGKTVVFDDIVQPDDVFGFSGSWKRGTLGTEIRVFVNGVLNTRVHTSCSQPIGPGAVFGDFEVVAGNSRVGGPLCPIQ